MAETVLKLAVSTVALLVRDLHSGSGKSPTPTQLRKYNRIGPVDIALREPIDTSLLRTEHPGELEPHTDFVSSDAIGFLGTNPE